MLVRGGEKGKRAKILKCFRIYCDIKITLASRKSSFIFCSNLTVISDLRKTIARRVGNAQKTSIVGSPTKILPK